MKASKIPAWAYYKDKHSCYDVLYIDMFLSPEFQALKRTEQLFYFVCRVQSRDKECRRCLVKHFYNDATNPFIDADLRGDEERKYIIQNDISHKLKDGYFVFPAKHLAKYGYSRSQGFKLLTALADKGFIEKVEKNQTRHKVNVYKFSDKWKQKHCATGGKQNRDNVSSQETKTNNVSSQETKSIKNT